MLSLQTFLKIAVTLVATLFGPVLLASNYSSNLGVTLSNELKTEEYWTIDQWKDWVEGVDPPDWYKPQEQNWSPPLNNINVGIHIGSIHRLNHVDQTFGIIGSVWSQWDGNLLGWDGQPLGKENPLELLLFNNIDSFDFEISSANQPYFANGLYSADINIDGKLHTNFDYRAFPFDDQKLVFDVELDTDGYEALIFANSEPTVMSDFNHIADYEVTKITTQNLVKYHPTAYGIADYGEDENFANGIVRTTLYLKRLYLNSLFDYIVPLIVIASLLLVNASRLSSDKGVKLSLPPAALLAIIFMQQFTDQQIPNLSYFTFLDCLYLCSYLLVFVCFFEAAMCRYEDDMQPEAILKIQRARLGCKIIMSLIISAGPILAWQYVNIQNI